MRVKLIIVLMTSCLLQVGAAGFAQTITLSAKNTTLEQVMKKIKLQSGLAVLYGSDLLDQAKVVNVNLKNVQLTAALDEIFKSQSLTYEVHEKTIVITRKKPSYVDRILAAFNAIDIKGHVTNAQNNSLASVNVSIKGSKKKYGYWPER